MGKLLASAATAENVTKLIERYWYSVPGSIELVETAANMFQVIQSKKIMDGFVVIKKGPRFRFEYRGEQE
jgi:Gpi18-like mannosyltransferase